MVTSVALHASEPLAAAPLAGTVLVAVMAARLLEGRLVLAHQAEQVLAQAASATRQRPPRPG